MIETPASQQFQLGLLALQNQLISPSTLVAAFETWWTDRSRQFGQILIDLGAISDASHRELAKLIKETNSTANVNSTLRTYEPERASESVAGSVATDLLLSGLDVSKATMKWEIIDSYDEQKRVQTNRSWNADNDRFRIVRQHARGGLGVVFVAEDRQLHRPVALKQIRDDQGDSDLVRSKFIQEAEITGQLEHPGIVPIYALGIDFQGNPYYAMRFIHGQDLGTRIREFHSDQARAKEAFDGPGLKHLLRRFLDVCNAMEYSHSRGVLHRDLKPANVMLGEFGETLVVDWGLAKMLPGFAKTGFDNDLPSASLQIVAGDNDVVEGETIHGQFMGTAAYASPEQLLGQLDVLGPYSDVYSLGAILFEMLTGHVPIIERRNTPSDMAEHINNDRIPNPRSLVSACPTSLEAICRKAMAARIDQRYQRAADLKNDLEAWLDDEPCNAHPDTVTMRISRWIRHHPVVVVTFTTVMVCSAIAIAALYGIATSKNRLILAEKKSAEIARDDAEAVTKFLTNALQSTDLDRLGEKVTVAETLRASESTLIEDRALTPSRKVHVASAILESYMGLGLKKEALRISVYMNQVCDENLDPSSSDTLLSRCHLATTYWFNGKSKEAIDLLEKYMPALVKVFPESNSDALSVQDNLAYMYMYTERTAEAEQLCRSSLAKYYKHNLLENPNSLQCLGNLVQILVGSDRRAEGIAMLKEAIVRAEGKLGPTHTVTLRLQQNLGEYITDPNEALELSRTAYNGSLLRYGKDHAEIIVFRNSLIANLVLLKKWVDAVPLLELSESDSIRINADKTVQASQIRSVLINAYLQIECYASVERLARKMLLPEYAEFERLPPQTASVVLAMALVRQNRQGEAEEVLADLQRLPGFQELSPASLAVLHGLQGEVAFAAGELDKAIKLLNESSEKLLSAEPKELYSQFPRHIAIALTKAYEMKPDETNRALWLERAKSLGYEEK